MAEPIVFADEDGDSVTIEVRRRMHRWARDFWDGNWLVSPITVDVGGFRASLGAGLRADELAQLRRGLQDLREDGSGTATLESLEEWLTLQVYWDGDELTVEGQALARHCSGTTLTFRLEEVQPAQLTQWISRLLEFEREFPIRDGDG